MSQLRRHNVSEDPDAFDAARIASFCGGATACTADFRPAMGVADEHGNVLYKLV